MADRQRLSLDLNRLVLVFREAFTREYIPQCSGSLEAVLGKRFLGSGFLSGTPFLTKDSVGYVIDSPLWILQGCFLNHIHVGQNQSKN